MSNQSVRIVEDEPAIFDLMHRRLRREGFRPVDAPNAENETRTPVLSHSRIRTSELRMEASVPRPARYPIALSQTHLIKDLVHLRHRQQRSTTFNLRLASSLPSPKVSANLQRPSDLRLRWSDRLTPSFPFRIFWRHVAHE